MTTYRNATQTFNNPYPVKLSRRVVFRLRLRTIRATYAYARACGYAPARAVASALWLHDIWLLDI